MVVRHSCSKGSKLIISSSVCMQRTHFAAVVGHWILSGGIMRRSDGDSNENHAEKIVFSHIRTLCPSGRILHVVVGSKVIPKMLKN